LGDCIFNGIGSPSEYVEYKYREKFGLSSAEMQNEPLDKFLMNIEIMSLENQKKDEDIRKANASN